MRDELGAYEWVPAGAVVVYPSDVTQQLFGHTSPASTRKEMSRYGIRAIHGWWVEEVSWVLGQRTKKAQQ